MLKLKLSATKIPPNEYPDVPTAEQIYAEFSLFVQDADGNIIRDVFKIKWDINCLLNWAVENKNSLLFEPFPMPTIVGRTLAESIRAFYRAVDLEDDEKVDEKLDEMYDYRTRHGLRFALRGVDILDIYLGLNSTGYEISCFDEIEGREPEHWAYQVDLESFIEDVECLKFKLQRYRPLHNRSQ